MQIWHNKTILTIKQQFQDNRLPHALFLVLRGGFYDEEIIEEIKPIILCDYNGDKISCDCQHCLLISQKTHPNIYELNAKDKLSINDVRQLEQSIWQTAVFPKDKIIIIHCVNLLSLNAQNALLKTLEEPPKNTVFLLSTDNQNDVLTTIISRTQKIQTYKTTDKEIESWLLKKSFDVDNVSYALQNSKNPQQALEIASNKDYKEVVELDKKNFFYFVNNRISAYNFVKKINFDDYVSTLNKYIGYTDKLILILLPKNKSEDEQLNRPKSLNIDVKDLYVLRDSLLDLIDVSKTNCNLELQTKSLLNRWQNDRTSNTTS